jgi:O-antigen ligase
MTLPANRDLIDESPVFLKNKFNFIVVLAVLLTTLFGWFNPNSWSIAVLAACRLFYGNPLKNIRIAFSNKVFLAFFIYFLIDVAGYLHTHNFATQGRTVTKEATWVAIAFAFCGGPFADKRKYRQLVTGYALLLVLTSGYCLVLAWRHYLEARTIYVFLYHTLTKPTSFNAVFYSVYVTCGIVFLMSPYYGDPAFDWMPPKARKVLRYMLVLFFLGMIVLLSSRLLLVVSLLIVINAFSRRFSYRKNKAVFLGGGAALVITVCVLFAIDNPIRARFRDMIGDLSVVKREKFYPKMYFNSLQSRLVEDRFALEILNDHHAWLFGVSPGDSQDILNQKYIDADMDIGDPSQGPNRKLRGFLDYNFHNQYVESLVRSGILGLVSFLAIFAVLMMATKRHGAKEGWYIIFTIAVFFIPEAPLTMQQGVFAFCFFPLMALSAPPISRLPVS